MDYAIETSNLTKEFHQSRNFPKILASLFQKANIFNFAVNNVNLHIKKGEIFGLIGPNGAGKSTLIKMLCCLIQPTKGTARVAGYDILKDEIKVKNSIGLVNGEERSFYWRLTGRQNLNFFASLYNIYPDVAKSKIKDLLDFFDIEEPDKKFQEYSTGIKQRLGIARSLLNNPKVLFMDEPTKSLDPGNARRLRAFIRNKLARQQNMNIFFATHNFEEAEYLADHLALIDKGEIKASGTVKEVRNEILTCFFAS